MIRKSKLYLYITIKSFSLFWVYRAFTKPPQWIYPPLQSYTFKCLLLNTFIPAARRCPSPQLVSNGELDYEDTVFQSTINYTCHEGSVVLLSGQLASSLPQSQSIKSLESWTLLSLPKWCFNLSHWLDFPPICVSSKPSLWLLLIYTHLSLTLIWHHEVTGDSALLHRYTMTGSNTAECLANGMWSSPAPVCRGT